MIAVDLFGLPADYDAIVRIAQAHDLKVIDDAAQSFGATYRNRKIGMLGDVTATSFFPAKPLGCYGDGGAVFTDDDDLAALIVSLRNHGAGEDRYDNVRIGMNGRLDTIQAAVLIEKLKIFADEIDARDRVARRYNALLGDIATVPQVPSGFGSVWAQYTIRLARRPARSARRGVARAGHPDRAVLSEAHPPADRLPALPAGRRRPAGDRPPRRRGHQPADARLSGRGDAGPHRRGGAGSARQVVLVMSREGGHPVTTDSV